MRFVPILLACLMLQSFAVADDADPFGLNGEPQVSSPVADEPTPPALDTTELAKRMEAIEKRMAASECTNPQCQCDVGGTPCPCGADCECGDDKTPEILSQAQQMAADFPDLQATNHLLEREVDDLRARVDRLESTQLDKADVEQIAEDVFRRLSLVVNKPSGGQELRTVQARMSNGAIATVQLNPGETLAACSDPSTGQFMHFPQPRLVSMPAYQQPVQSYQFQDFEVRQSPILANGTRNVAVRFGGNCAGGQCGASSRPISRFWR